MKGSKKRRLRIVIVTGFSGAGKSVALDAFEDSGFFCVDNLPTSLIKTFVHLCHKTTDIKKVAIGADIRERKFSTNLAGTFSSLKKIPGIEILFLEAKEDSLIRRFKETRRPHPLGHKDLKSAIHREIKILSGIKDMADRVVDTSPLTPHHLRKKIIQLYSGEKEESMIISLITFGYKYGAPTETDLLFDVRFLPNPNFIKELRPYDGTAPKVKKFILSRQDTKHFLARFYPLLEFLIQKYKDEGRKYLTIGIGCTGGRHRSPAIAVEVRDFLRKKKLDVSVTNRDMHEL